MSTILGAHSPKLDAVRALRTKAGRAAQGRYAVEGATMLAEATAAGAAVESLFLTARGAETLDAALRAAHAGRTFTVDERAMTRISDLESPPGILAVLPAVLEPAEDLLDGAPAIALAGVSDPGNAGTLLRAAEIFGFSRAIFTADAVEPHNPKVVRATMGALFRMRLAVAGGASVVAAAADARYTVVAAAREGTPLPDYDFPNRVLLAVGNERRGVAESLPTWDAAVSIPHVGRGESLNAASAGSIIFYAFSLAARSTISELESGGNR